MDPYGNKIRELKQGGPAGPDQAKMWVGYAESLPDGEEKRYSLAQARKLAKAKQTYESYPKDENGNVIASYGTNHPSGNTGSVAFPEQGGKNPYAAQPKWSPYGTAPQAASKQSAAAPTPRDSQPPENSMCGSLRSQYHWSKVRESEWHRKRDIEGIQRERERQAQLLSQMQSLGCQ